MPGHRWIVPILVSVAGAAIVSGCGGGGPERVTAAQLVQRADRICASERSSFARVQAHPPPNASAAADQTDELIKVTRDANSQLRGLQPPEDLQGAYDRYLEARDRAVDAMNRGKDAAASRDSEAYGAAQAAVAREAPQRRRLARALRFKVCSSSRVTA